MYSLHLAFCSVGNVGGVRLTTHFHLMPQLRMIGVRPPHPVYAFVACTEISLISALFWDPTQCRMVIPYQCFRTTYWSHLQVSSRSLKMGPIRCPGMSVRSCHSALCGIPEECRSHLHCSGSLKSRTDIFVFLPST